MTKIVEAAKADNLFYIPLKDIVPFPRMSIGCEISSKRLIKLCRTAEKKSQELFLTYSNKDGKPTPLDPNDSIVGVIATIKSISELRNGNIQVFFECLWRCDCVGIRKDKSNNITVDVVTKATLKPDCDKKYEKGLMGEIVNCVREIASHSDRFSQFILTEIKNEHNLDYLCDFVASSVLQPTDKKLAILYEYDPLKRAKLLLSSLYSEIDLIDVEESIRSKVKESMDKNERNYYLREKMRAIREELGTDNDNGADSSISDEIAEYGEKLFRLKIEDADKKHIEKEIKKLAKLSDYSSEANAIRRYLDTVFEIPWDSTPTNTDIETVRTALDEDHYGLEKVKSKILEYVAVQHFNPNASTPILCLVGPPGVGKTSISTSLAKALGREYVQVSLGGINDESDIRGHRKTYIASMPGRIINALIRANCNNPLILLDEIDKMCSNSRGDPVSAMLEVLDPEQHKKFRDHFVEIAVDLSECMFVCTANSTQNIPRPLLDRMELINIDSYTRDEKFAIATKHLIPKQRKLQGVKPFRLKFEDEAIYQLIDCYTCEAGVRELERKIAGIMRRTAYRIVNDGTRRIKVTASNIGKLVDGHKVEFEKICENDEVGVVNGLAYTQAGGDLLKIEVASFPGTGRLELTGSLGDVMKESAHAAISYIRSNADKLGVDPDFYKNKDIHIHVPEGAIPKDGPSAGVTIMTALVSELSGKAVKADVAMTGEITLRGRVLAIGGLREKSSAAYRAGVKTVLIPKSNLDDLKDVDPTIVESMNFIPCASADDVLRHALVEVQKPIEISCGKHVSDGIINSKPLAEVTVC